MEALAGSWTLDKSENYDGFLKAVGMGGMKRGIVVKLAASLTITALAGGKYKIVTVNGPKTKERDVTLGEEFEDEGPDGGKSKGAWNVEGGKMVGKFLTPKGKTLTITREIVNGNLQQTMDLDGVVAKRTFKKK